MHSIALDVTNQLILTYTLAGEVITIDYSDISKFVNSTKVGEGIVKPESAVFLSDFSLVSFGGANNFFVTRYLDPLNYEYFEYAGIHTQKVNGVLKHPVSGKLISYGSDGYILQWDFQSSLAPGGNPQVII